MNPDIELFQFRHSHYCGKVRWALEYKNLPYTRTDLLPGPHARILRKLTNQTQVPVVRIGSRYVHDSAWIIECLELMYPDAPRLYPIDEETEARAREIARHFDRVVGPAARICAFDAMLGDRDYVARLFCTGRSTVTRALYRAALPLLMPRIKRANGMIDHWEIVRARRLVDANMESLVKLTYKDGYLAGGVFSIADLTAAAMIAPLVDPPYPDVQGPQPVPAKLAELTQRWRNHPAGRWALEIYARHRVRATEPPTSVAV